MQDPPIILNSNPIILDTELVFLNAKFIKSNYE